MLQGVGPLCLVPRCSHLRFRSRFVGTVQRFVGSLLGVFAVWGCAVQVQVSRVQPGSRRCKLPLLLGWVAERDPCSSVLRNGLEVKPRTLVDGTTCAFAGGAKMCKVARALSAGPVVSPGPAASTESAAWTLRRRGVGKLSLQHHGMSKVSKSLSYVCI